MEFNDDVHADGVTQKGVSRRTLVKGAAWSVPLVAAAAAAPAYASSVDGCGPNANLQSGTFLKTGHYTYESPTASRGEITFPSGSPLAYTMSSDVLTDTVYATDFFSHRNLADTEQKDTTGTPRDIGIGLQFKGIPLDTGVPVPDLGREVRTTINFARPVSKLAFRITNITAVDNPDTRIWNEVAGVMNVVGGTYRVTRQNSNIITSAQYPGLYWNSTGEETNVPGTDPNDPDAVWGRNSMDFELTGAVTSFQIRHLYVNWEYYLMGIIFIPLSVEACA